VQNCLPFETGTESATAAKEAGLVYSDDSRAGFSRKRSGNGFFYFDAKGQRIADKATLDRIRRIVIPPAKLPATSTPSLRPSC